MNETADRIMYALELIDRSGETIAVTVRWADDAGEHAVTLRLTEVDYRIPRKVLRNVKDMLYAALNRRRSARIFQLMKDGR